MAKSRSESQWQTELYPVVIASEAWQSRRLLRPDKSGLAKTTVERVEDKMPANRFAEGKKKMPGPGIRSQCFSSLRGLSSPRHCEERSDEAISEIATPR